MPTLPLLAAAIEQLEQHHRDPFDRLLVAQALAEPLKLVTAVASAEAADAAA